ncbi:MAG: MarR family transcriptional regulator [Candidatus Gastranaerophilales bacterium]|nr:MarR family transcriptional regulator [Candidatus Gastranaerophilales bacterium]
MEKNSKYIPYSESLFYAAELISKAFSEVAKKIHAEMDFGVNHEEFRILETIYANPGIIQINIAKSILMKRSYVCKFLNQLEEKGYIRKEKAIKGKSQVIVENYITPQGKEVYLKVVKDIEKLISSNPLNYNQKELNRTKDILLVLAARLKKDFNLKY